MAASDKRKFACLPVGAFSDERLTGLDLRVLGVIALHDGMSKVKGEGGGCYAAFRTLAGIAKTDVTNFSKSLSKLSRFGYVSREPQVMDKRRFTLFVEYPASTTNVVGRLANNGGEVVGEMTNDQHKVVGDAEGENGGSLPVSEMNYIPSNGELDSVETGELNSTKWRNASAPRVLFGGGLKNGSGDLCRFERAFKSDWTSVGDLVGRLGWLREVQESAEADGDNPTASQAGRIAEAVESLMEQVAWENPSGTLPQTWAAQGWQSAA